MESVARRRIALLSSHISPPTEISKNICFTAFSCSSSSTNGGNECNPQKEDCVFCKIVRGKAPALKVYEDEVCLCILDKNPLCHGHSLIIPKRHFPSLDATPSSIIAEMFSKVPFVSNAVMKATGCDSFNLLVNNGAAAGQVIFHTHIHIIPRKMKDCLWTSESLQRLQLKVDHEASELAACIKANLSVANNTVDSKGQVSSLVGN